MNVPTFYKDRLKQYGDSTLALGWGNKKSQEVRFKVLSEIGEVDGKSILDVGCGTGDLYNYLKDRRIKYTGTDITPEFINIAKEKYHFARFLDRIPDEIFDYVFESGIFNLPDENWDEMMVDTLMDMWEHCRLGMAVNFLSSYAINKTAGIKYTDPLEILKFIPLLTPKFILRHDYKENDFTIYCYR